MSVEFNEEKTKKRTLRKKKPFLDLLQKIGIVKNERDASIILIGVVVVLFVVIAILVYSATTENVPERYQSKWSDPSYYTEVNPMKPS